MPRQHSSEFVAEFPLFRGGSRTAATCKMEVFVIIVYGLESLTIITKSSILDIAAVLDTPLLFVNIYLGKLQI